MELYFKPGDFHFIYSRRENVKLGVMSCLHVQYSIFSCWMTCCFSFSWYFDSLFVVRRFTLYKCWNELLRTQKLDESKHSNFKRDCTQTQWFVFNANLNLIKLEIQELFGPNIGNWSPNLSSISKKGWILNLICVRIQSSKVWWNSNLMESELIQALHFTNCYVRLSNNKHSNWAYILV